MSYDLRSDRPALDPHLVATQGFSTGFRGFDTSEVRAYLEALAGLLQNAADREADLRERLEDAERRASAPPEFDEHQFTVVLGQETTRVLDTARQAAVEIRAKSEDNAGRLVREASEAATLTRTSAEEYSAQLHATADEEVAAQRAEADAHAARVKTEADEHAKTVRSSAEEYAARLRGEAESVLGERTAEAEAAAAVVKAQSDQARADAEAELASLRQATAAELDELRARASIEAAAEIETARQEGRGMVAEARAVRGRMLTDLAERRRAGRAQLDLLRGARQQLMDALESMRSRIDETTSDLATTVIEARSATDEAARRDEADDAILRALMADDRAAMRAPDAAAEAEASGGTAHGSTAVQSAVIVDVSEAVVTGDPPPPAGGGTAADTPAATDTDDPQASIDLRASGSAEPPEAPTAEPVDTAKTDEAAEDDQDAGDVDPEAAARAADHAARARDATTALLERRDAATDEIERQLARRLKRVLSDEQNELLDEVRRAGGVPTADADAARARQPTPAATPTRLPTILPVRRRPARRSTERLRPTVTTQVDDIADRLADELVRQLRGRLDALLLRCRRRRGRARGTHPSLLSRMEDASASPTPRATSCWPHSPAGCSTPHPDATVFRWIVDDGGTPCPDAEDNALQGHVAEG